MQINTPTTNNPCLPLHELAHCLPKHPVLSTGWLWGSLCCG
jgi:hypothetical protein